MKVKKSTKAKVTAISLHDDDLDAIKEIVHFLRIFDREVGSSKAVQIALRSCKLNLKLIKVCDQITKNDNRRN